jgi:hypothetical protein
LTRSGYDVRSLAEQFDAKPAEVRRLVRGDLDPAHGGAANLIESHHAPRESMARLASTGPSPQ